MFHDSSKARLTRFVSSVLVRLGARRCFVPVACALALGSSLGCGAQSLDLGDPELAVDRAALSSYVATWTGYAEAFRFPSGSDRVHIAVSDDGTAVLLLGEGVPPPVPTDPEEPFPGDSGKPGTVLRPQLVEGFSYDVEGARVEAERLRLQARSAQQFDAACELQTSFEDVLNPGTFSCLPNTGGSVQEDGCFIGPEPVTQVSCGKVELCVLQRACECSAQGCTGLQGEDVELDAALDDDGAVLVGTLRVPYGTGSATVRLSRVEP